MNSFVCSWSPNIIPARQRIVIPSAVRTYCMYCVYTVVAMRKFPSAAVWFVLQSRRGYSSWLLVLIRGLYYSYRGRGRWCMMLWALHQAQLVCCIWSLPARVSIWDPDGSFRPHYISWQFQREHEETLWSHLIKSADWIPPPKRIYGTEVKQTETAWVWECESLPEVNLWSRSTMYTNMLQQTAPLHVQQQQLSQF